MLANAEAMAGRFVPPYHLSAYRASRFQLDVTVLEDAMQEGRGDVARLARRARASARAAQRVAGKMARDWLLVYRIAGRLRWLLGDQRGALRWWSRAVTAGTQLGAQPELGRVYREIGQRLSDPSSTRHELGGLSAAEYLAKARGIFTALQLDWDLGRIDARRRAA